MSIDMYLSQSKQQASSVKSMVSQQLEGYDSLVEAISSFGLSAPSLSGKTYDSARSYFLSVLLPLAKGGKLLSEKVQEVTQQLPDGYTSEVDSCDLKESELDTKIAELEQVIEQKRLENRQLQILMVGLSSEEAAPLRAAQRSNSSMIQTTGEALRKVKEKREKLLAYNTKSATLFSEIESLRTNVATGTGLTATAWNGKGFTIPSSKKMQWAKEINAQWEIREWEERLRKAKEKYDTDGNFIGIYVDGQLDGELTKLYGEYKKVESNAFWSGFVDQLLNNNGKTITDATLGKLFGKITIGEKYTIYQNYQNGQTWGNFVSLAQGVVEVLIGGVMNIGGKGGGLVLAPETGGASVAVGEGVSLAGVAVGAHGSAVATLAFSGLMSGGGSGYGDNEKPIYNANGDPDLRALRRPQFDEVLKNGFPDGTKLGQHAYNSLFKSGRKDIMPDDIIDALKSNPLPADPGSVKYVNPKTGTSVFVNPETNTVVGIWPQNFKQ